MMLWLFRYLLLENLIQKYRPIKFHLHYNSFQYFETLTTVVIHFFYVDIEIE